ncbi:MAG: hypothetical protein ACLP1X_31670 [Polyangiaceae bacterium]|jgi:hypothetical protein
MSLKRSLGFLSACALAAAIAQGCSVTTTTTSQGDGGTTIRHLGDAMVIVVGDDGGGDAGGSYDGTSGKPCTTDADCTSATGPGINKCSNDFTFVVTNVKTQLVPDPICIVPPSNTGNCDPAPASDPTGEGIHFCDGPDDATSPGICFALTQPPTSGEGACLPVCTFPLDGSGGGPSGCVAKGSKNTCFPFAFGFDANNNPTGYGYCQGSCQADADCSALGTGYVCQTDIGACTKTPVKRTKVVGQACAADPTMTAGNDNATGACNCLPDTTSNMGYCTTACVVGGDPCANGWICDNLEPNELQAPDGTVLTVTVENVQTPGVCMPGCSLADGGTTAATDSGVADAASAVDGGAAEGGSSAQACPAASVCEQITPAGPDCVP